MNPNAAPYLPAATSPSDFPRRVLLAVSGLTPQIVTETIYALAADEHAPFVPTEVQLVTSAEGVHVMRDAHGQPMNDIRSPSDNQAAADFITAQVRAITADPACALHASIAGGRKTMGFYLGYALSLYGRAQDRLSHVMVTAEHPIDISLRHRPGQRAPDRERLCLPHPLRPTLSGRQRSQRHLAALHAGADGRR